MCASRKLGEWDDEDGFGPSRTDEDKAQEASRAGRVVVLKHMFTLEELEEDASLLLDLKEEVRLECETLGEVTNVVLYDESIPKLPDIDVTLRYHLFPQKEPEGIMSVKFKDPLSAQACILVCRQLFGDYISLN